MKEHYNIQCLFKHGLSDMIQIICEKGGIFYGRFT